MTGTIHLVTVVGEHIATLEPMLEHYRALGVDSFFVNLHLSSEDDPVREQVFDITKRFGCGVATVTVGNWRMVQQELYIRQRYEYPDDWFILADQDEFHEYPRVVRDILAECERRGYHSLRGCFVDRIARDGGFPALDKERPLSEQFPLGAAITLQLLNGDPRKVVAARGPILIDRGQHRAREGKGCPTRQYFIPVHHYKWIAGITERLARRVELLRERGEPAWEESQRLVDYCYTRPTLDLENPAFLVAECDPSYRRWEEWKSVVLRLPLD